MNSWADTYKFADVGDLTTRVRRLERGQQSLRRGKIVSPSGGYGGIPLKVLDGSNIDITSTNLSLKGSIPPSGVSGKFGFSATTTSITIYWDGTNSSSLLSLLRADGSVVQIPGGSLTISSLSANTMYGFLPYWSAFNTCGIAWIVGDSGSPSFAFTSAAMTAFALSQQVLQGREQLTSGFLTYTTPNAGSSSGSGSYTGGGQGQCVMLGTDIEPVGELPFVTRNHPNSEWFRIECKDYPRSLNCTANHPLFSPDKGKQRADVFKRGDWIITDSGERKISEVSRFLRVCTKVEVAMDQGHLFWANGFLSHNVKNYNNVF